MTELLTSSKCSCAVTVFILGSTISSFVSRSKNFQFYLRTSCVSRPTYPKTSHAQQLLPGNTVKMTKTAKVWKPQNWSVTFFQLVSSRRYLGELLHPSTAWTFWIADYSSPPRTLDANLQREEINGVSEICNRWGVGEMTNLEKIVQIITCPVQEGGRWWWVEWKGPTKVCQPQNCQFFGCCFKQLPWNTTTRGLSGLLRGWCLTTIRTLKKFVFVKGFTYWNPSRMDHFHYLAKCVS